MLRTLVVLLAAAALAGCASPPREAAGGATDDLPAPDAAVVAFYAALQGPEVRFETDLGTIRMMLYEDLMPTTAGRFLDLVAAGFYDGTLIHRVVDDFVIQGGDPSGTGMLGSGETVPFESHPDLHFGAGAVGLARDVDPDSGDSQWFITEKPQPHLHDASVSSTGAVFGTYAMYGQVFEGMEVVRRIAAVATVPGLDRPVEDVRVVSAAAAGPPPVDLLALPRLVVAGASAAPAADLERPFHLFAAQSAVFTAYVEPVDGREPPASVLVRLQGAMGAANATLEPLADDPWVFAGTVTPPAAGEYEALLSIDRETLVGTVEVLPWHDAYSAFRAS